MPESTFAAPDINRTPSAGLTEIAVNGVPVSVAAPLPVSASVTIDPSSLATSAKQDTGNTSLASIKTDLDSLVTATADLLVDGDHLATIDTSTAAMVPGIQGWIAATGTGTATTNDSLTFAQQVRKVVLYNAASVPVPFEFDATAAADSIPIQPGQYMIFDGVLCTVVHVFPSATLPINTTAGLYVKGWK
jgi:hypothetical protein